MDNYWQLLSVSDAELAKFDVVEMNLLVAKSIPTLAHLEIVKYQEIVNGWADEVVKRIAAFEHEFYLTPQDWDNDIHMFRLGIMCGVLGVDADIQYKEEHRDLKTIRYTNPSDLFLDGVIDTRRGTCGNMSTLYVAVGRKLGWPVALAKVRCHMFCRFDNGQVTHNIEATYNKPGAFKVPPDKSLIEENSLPWIAIESGSDLRALSPREELGLFVGLRARHMRDIGCIRESELDYLLARRLFPNSRHLFTNSIGTCLPRSLELFIQDEIGSPEALVRELLDYHCRKPKNVVAVNPIGRLRGIINTPIY